MSDIELSGLKGYRELMYERLRLRCGYDTSSLSADEARAVLRSTAFVLRAGLGQSTADARECFEAGLAALTRRLERARGALAFARATAPAVDNLALAHTLDAGLAEFFARYDVQFAAHEVPADIDYPLCLPVDGAREGLDYIEEYLRRLTYEHMWLAGMDGARLSALLRERFASPRELVFNVFSVALEHELERSADGFEPAVLEVSARVEGAARGYVLRAAQEAGAYVRLRRERGKR